jgi:hypothetical protein
LQGEDSGFEFLGVCVIGEEFEGGLLEEEVGDC